MSSPALRDRLVSRGNAGRYDLFFNLGALLTVVGLALFGLAVSSGQSDRAWHLFHARCVAVLIAKGCAADKMKPT